MPARIESLLAMLERGQDSALLRFSLGNEYINADKYSLAINHLQCAVKLDANYSAAWKLLGTALANQNCITEAIQTYHQGIKIAETNGDYQSAKEMSVFLRRLEKIRNS
jgi:predicted Zn-dependent protease